ncbi:MAG: sel1 repeat family protein [Gammaproteobacteria bacterium]|nr:sel1 repeat family protein [Gammaproteobacteria bacterium]MCW5583403.1 sel1 repeat family protein [Gammaproteobacteria bacterium]
MIRALLICLLSLSLFACATPSPRMTSELQQGKRYFHDGYYRRAMRQLLPLACDGNAEAQYAVGYMYYYGLGVAQDTDVGDFWIKRSANQGYAPAIQALHLISTDKDAATPTHTWHQKTYLRSQEPYKAH